MYHNIYDLFGEMDQWYQSVLGRALIDEEANHIIPLTTFQKPKSLRCIQLLGAQYACSVESIWHFERIVLVQKHCRYDGRRLSVELFFPLLKPCSVDFFLMVHVLEFIDNPFEFLESLEKALTSEGHLMIVCFNPYSLWRVMAVLGKLPVFFSSIHWRSKRQAKHLLVRSGFEVKSCFTGFFRPPFSQKKSLRRWFWLEKYGFPGDFYGAFYGILVKKRAASGTIVRRDAFKLKTVTNRKWVQGSASRG